MTKIVFRLLNKKFCLKMFGLITLQQVLVALGTAALALAGQNLNHPKVLLGWIVAFLVLSILPHIVTVFLRKTEMQGYFAAYFNFIDLRLLSKTGTPELWAHHGKKEDFQTAIGPEAENYLTAVAFSIFDIFLYVLTIVLNLVAISMIVDSQFVWAFALSALLSWLAFSKLAPLIEKLIEEEQTHKMAFLGYLLKSWDNVFLKNTQINDNYKTNLRRHYEKTHQLIGKAHGSTELLVLILTVISSLPVFAIILYLCHSHLNDAAYLAALMVTVPKQLNVLSNFRNFFQQITNLSSFQARFKSYWENSELSASDLPSRISPKKIKVNNKGLTTLGEFICEVRRTSSGRKLITGENGAGKSSLLVHLNAQLEDSFYLPSNPNLEINEDTANASTGERILKYLEFIAQNPPSVLLLDEWDANLDSANRDRIDRKITELSLHCLIIEIRHRL